MASSIESNPMQLQTSGAFRRQIPTIREMLGSLDTVTITGQQHLMSKVVGFIRDCGEDAVRGVEDRDQRMVTELLDCLALESSRPLPDVRQFAMRAESLVALLAEARY